MIKELKVMNCPSSCRRKSIFLFCSLLARLATAAVAAQKNSALEYNRDIRPILSENCFPCHGTDSASRKAGLRLDHFENATNKLDDDAIAIVPGQPDKSELVRRIFATDDDQMPPAEANKVLKPAQKELLKKWIAAGAKYEPHWSFIAPVKAPLPKVRNQKWVRNPIDDFILARLEQEKLKPNTEADKRTLIRRVSLDLTGLPPTPEEVEAFVDDKSPDAYEKLVDRLLASPQWGEHRARYWLDAARYADTHGIHFDNYREMWTYRDWVINAFNANMPFDQFTIEQLAGDLLPNATLDQQIGSGFNRCNITTQRRRRDRRGVSRALRARPHGDDVAGLAGPDGRLRGLPRPQVRSALAEGVLRAVGVLQQHDAEGDGRQHQGHAAGIVVPSRRIDARWEQARDAKCRAAESKSSARKDAGPRRFRRTGSPQPDFAKTLPAQVPTDELGLSRAA